MSSKRSPDPGTSHQRQDLRQALNADVEDLFFELGKMVVEEDGAEWLDANISILQAERSFELAQEYVRQDFEWTVEAGENGWESDRSVSYESGMDSLLQLATLQLFELKNSNELANEQRRSSELVERIKGNLIALIAMGKVDEAFHLLRLGRTLNAIIKNGTKISLRARYLDRTDLIERLKILVIVGSFLRKEKTPTKKDIRRAYENFGESSSHVDAATFSRRIKPLRIRKHLPNAPRAGNSSRS